MLEERAWVQIGAGGECRCDNLRYEGCCPCPSAIAGRMTALLKFDVTTATGAQPVQRLFLVLATLFASAIGVADAAAQWPARPVRIINTFAVGGAADVMARLVADHLSTAFGQQFYVETRAGAGGLIGVQSVLQA